MIYICDFFCYFYVDLYGNFDFVLVELLYVYLVCIGFEYGGSLVDGFMCCVDVCDLVFGYFVYVVVDSFDIFGLLNVLFIE